MTETTTDSTDRTRIVEEEWVRRLEEYGVPEGRAETLVTLVFADPRLDVDPDPGEIEEAVAETLEGVDLADSLPPGADPGAVIEDLLAVLRAGLRGERPGPAVAPREVALAGRAGDRRVRSDEPPSGATPFDGDDAPSRDAGITAAGGTPGPDSVASPDRSHRPDEPAVGPRGAYASGVAELGGRDAGPIGRAIDELVDALGDEDPSVRASAADALGDATAAYAATADAGSASRQPQGGIVETLASVADESDLEAALSRLRERRAGDDG